VKAGFEQKPVNFVSFSDAAHFANWLNNGQPVVDSLSRLTSRGRERRVRHLFQPDVVRPQPGATIFLPSENEWYKAAYYDSSSSSYFSGRPARTARRAARAPRRRPIPPIARTTRARRATSCASAAIPDRRARTALSTRWQRVGVERGRRAEQSSHPRREHRSGLRSHGLEFRESADPDGPNWPRSASASPPPCPSPARGLSSRLAGRARDRRRLR
jgi:hypothetical protein